MTLTIDQRKRIYKHVWKKGGPNLCFYCRCRVTRSTRTLDHLTPKSRGGGATIDNMVLACQTCNNAKADMTLVEFNSFVLLNGGIERVAKIYGKGSESRKHLICN